MLNLSSSEKSKVISAVSMASVSNVSNLTADRVVALTGGHGMVNMAIHTVANVITEELLKGESLTIEFADARRLPIDDLMGKAIRVAKKSGADSANAALIVACIMYLAGSKAQVGIPAGNRKLGATARMLAGADRVGVANVPTAKMNNKISGFPAVMAIYQAIMRGELTSYDGRNVPEFVAGGPLYGHSALGEDYIWPEMAENGARIGTQAMLDAMAGAGMRPHGFTAAVLGAAAILEIIHPDAEVPEESGVYGRTSSAYLVGKAAATTAGLPEKLHMKVTGEVYNTAQVIGDVGLILKDIGGPSVIGMMAFDEIFAAFSEMISGFSGSPINAPIGHVGAYAVIGMKALLENEGQFDKVAELIAKERGETSFDPEVALISINTICRKANELHSGPVTKMLIEATEPARASAIYRRAEFVVDELSSGKELSEVVKILEDERIANVENNANRILGAMAGEKVEVKVLKIEPGARRTTKVAKKYLAFDPLVDISVTIGDKSATLENFVHELLPEISRGERDDIAWAAPFAATVVSELILASVCILNIVIPAAIATALELHSPKDAGTIAEKAAYITGAIPGGKAAATDVGKLALRIMRY
ncbi:hypothetical protein [Anaerosphaera multitolerans]|uniref:Uncharacterized protein n=1 Tax=Anaerosphaera multitolerans TaxID=2487351 RepID=A0A437S913_9FIRM|nr:hypothetical protein [Anaerosphaera multitolerans]RVU55502.1 hypothetical protein EF514_01885 [Anaerosphaera multitolerans]